jgi:hypothetical protein
MGINDGSQVLIHRTRATQNFLVRVVRLSYGKHMCVPMQSVPITTLVVSSNPAHSEVYSIQHCVIEFVSDLRQVDCLLRFPPQIKMKYC